VKILCNFYAEASYSDQCGIKKNLGSSVSTWVLESLQHQYSWRNCSICK